MLKIGEFSALTGISIYMLRNYDKIGLLHPEFVDSWSGYRYYSESQMLEAGRIQVLKDLGFGLKDISSLKGERISGAAMAEVLKSGIEKKKKEADAARRQMFRMECALRDLDLEDPCALSVYVKNFPARNVVGLRAWVDDFPEEGILWKRLNEICRERGIVLSDVRYSFAVTHKIDLNNEGIDTEVQLVVDKVMEDLEPIRFQVIPETLVAAVAYRGVYSRIGDINKHICRWVEENDYVISGTSFQAYYISPESGEEPDNFVTEVCFPIIKK